MKWITRERVRIDRAASAWLIKKFIDAEAQFLFVPRDQVLTVAQREQAIPFHVPEAELGQTAAGTGFEVIAAKYAITDRAVQRLGEIVRAAEKRGTALEGVGLYAMIHGFFLMELPDEQALELEFPLFDALYRYCQDRVIRESAAEAKSV
jgi:hypothetical protein